MRWATLLATAVALTVAQPIGAVTTREHRLPPSDAHASDAGDLHVLRTVGGVPLLPFALYRREALYPGDGGPQASLRARSWLWLPLLTNGAQIASMCGGSTPLCWYPAGGRAVSLAVAVRMRLRS